MNSQDIKKDVEHVPAAEDEATPSKAAPSLDSPEAAAPASATVHAGSANAVVACQNCGSPLYGEHCYACGQPTRGLVRHFSSILGDILDTLFNIDGRIVRTLPALLFKPGFLSREYFAGHRVRYVSPVRLFVFLCIGTFFAAKLATPSLHFDQDDKSGISINTDNRGAVAIDAGDQDDFGNFATATEVEAQRKKALADIDKALQEMSGVPGMGLVLDKARDEVNTAADQRLAELAAARPDGSTPETANAAETASPSDDPENRGVIAGPGFPDKAPSFQFNDKPWNAETNPVAISFLPDTANDWLNAQIGHVPKNWQRVQEDPDLLRNAFYSALPTALFVLVPAFAMFLKLLYIYKRRLYMEHLVSALHGHAFVCLMLLVLMSLTAVERGLGEPAWLSAPLGWIEWLCALWVPVYLWLHLKRVYGQGALLTTIKFATLGLAELFMLSIVAVAALVAALVWL
jgi:hypothetical protein